MGRKVNTIEHILSRSVRDRETGCLIYTGAVNRKGYPKISSHGRTRLGSHIVYEQYYGAIPAGYEIDHICHVRRCIEPSHLRALTHRENVIQIQAYVAQRSQRIKTFIDEYPHVEFFPVLLTLTELQALWECTCTGNVRKLLRTMSHAFPEEFCYERFAAGRGRNPDLYAIGIQPSLIAKLSNEDEQRETSAEDIMALVA